MADYIQVVAIIEYPVVPSAYATEANTNPSAEDCCRYDESNYRGNFLTLEEIIGMADEKQVQAYFGVVER